MNCSDLMTQIGVSGYQASADLSSYTCVAHDNIANDRRLRTQVRQPGCKAMSDKLDAGCCLAQLRLDTDGILSRNGRRIADLPDYDSAPKRGVDAATLRAVVIAVLDAEPIEIQQQSLSRPEPSWSWIAPHAIAFDGFWSHVPALFLTYEVFRIFLLSHFPDIRGSQQSKAPADNDFAWHTNVTLEIRPPSDLSETQAKVIALGCGMLGGKAEIKVRPALLCYALRRIGLDTELAARKPQDQPIVLLNREVIYEGHG